MVIFMEQMNLYLLNWYQQNKRDLPWRKDQNPYHVWISEIMLQQTRIEAVIGYYDRFIKRLPSIQDLAQINDDELLKLWEGLGYYTRARNLKKAAIMIMEEYDGIFPNTFEQTMSLPGIGEYTASAIGSICFSLKEVTIDGNVLRVYMRLQNCYDNVDDLKIRRKVRNELQKIMPEEAGDFNQALMELGELRHDELDSLGNKLKHDIVDILALAVDIDSRGNIAVDSQLCAVDILGHRQTEVLTFLILLKKREQAQTASVVADDNKVKLAVIRPCERSRLEAAAVPTGIRRDAEQDILLYRLAVVNSYGELMTYFLAERLESRRDIRGLTRHKRHLLEIGLLRANLGVHAHRALVDGYLVAALDNIKLDGYTRDLSLDIAELLLCAEQADKIVARAQRDNCDLAVGIAVSAVDHLIESSVAAAGIEAERFAGFCVFPAVVLGVALTFCDIDLIVETRFAAIVLNLGTDNALGIALLSCCRIDEENMFHK